MPNSLKCKIKHLCHNGTIKQSECDRLIKALEQEPCEDAVSREDALTALTGDITGYTIEDYIARTRVRLQNLPPVTPKPRTGHWRHYEGMLICSECGTEFYDDIIEYCGDDVPKWCPDCGCRMFEPKEGESE